MRAVEWPDPIVLSTLLQPWNAGVRSLLACAMRQKIFAPGLSPPNSIRCALSTIHVREMAEQGAQEAMVKSGLRVESAREHVWRAVVAVGGPASPGGSCLWHVVGWERSLKEWALEQGWNGRRISQETASGILVAALGALEAHYGRGKSLRKSDL